MRSCVFILATVGMVLAATQGFSQARAATNPSFVIISIKPSAPGTRLQIAIEPGGRFVANGVQLNLLIALAYHLQAYQLSGGDRWMATDQWSIEARADDVSAIPPWAPPYIPDVIAVRLQSLLEERFGLKMHRDTKEMQVYALVIDKSGSKLTPVDAPPQASPGQPSASPGTRAPSNPDGTLPPHFAPPPGATVAGPGKVIASAITINQFVTLLNRMMGQPVIDKTGLTGYFNISLQFDPETAARTFAPPPVDVPAAAPPSNDPSIFTAIQEQLGLKLESTKEPVEVLVIDSAQRPAEN